MKKNHEVAAIFFEGETMCLTIDGRLHRFSLRTISKRLSEASRDERERFTISPSGYGIHWPLIDEDLSIDALLGITHHPQRSQREAVKQELD
jgi:hypothetical protein